MYTDTALLGEKARYSKKNTGFDFLYLYTGRCGRLQDNLSKIMKGQELHGESQCTSNANCQQQGTRPLE